MSPQRTAKVYLTQEPHYAGGMAPMACVCLGCWCLLPDPGHYELHEPVCPGRKRDLEDEDAVAAAWEAEVERGEHDE